MRVRLGPLGTPAVLLVAWIGIRTAMLWPEPNSDRQIVSQRPDAKSQISATASLTGYEPLTVEPSRVEVVPSSTTYRRTSRERSASVDPELLTATHGAESDYMSVVRDPEPAAFRGRSGVVAGYSAPASTRRAFSGSAWALINGTGGAVGIPSLGGSQAGMRVYLQGVAAPLALTVRVSRALGSLHDTEVSAGYALRTANLGLLVERRERLDVRSGAFVVTGYGGVYDQRLPAGLRLDGFAQGGIAGLRQRRWFADGQARVTRRAAVTGKLILGAGGGAWASAQQGAYRIEAGPLIEARVRTGAVGLRVAGEYRLRLVGTAAPRSGPALTLGLDF
jgi:hypothetical protein